VAARRTRQQVKRWSGNGRTRKRLQRLMTRDADPMAIRDRELTPNVVPALKRKG
jgi:hypothetical protein